MKCFCADEVMDGWFPFGAKDGKFSAFEKDENKKIPNYCMKHFELVVSGTVVGLVADNIMVILNSIIATIFSFMGEFAKFHTTIEQ